MKRLLVFLFLSCGVFAERGIVVSTNDSYAKRYLLGSLFHLREVLNCKLPIEIWHDGDELSEKIKVELSQISGITFCDFETIFNKAFGSLRGWHSKPFMLIGTRFTEICLMDADLYFFKDPEVMFEHEKYLRTGAFFFRDRWNDFPQRGESFTLREYLNKRDLYRKMIPVPSEYVPRSFLHVWNEDRIPTFDHPLPIDCQESGCLFIDRSRHENGISKVIHIAKNRAVNLVYDILFGDKETYWLGFELAEEPYAFNDHLASTVRSGPNVNIMIQIVDGDLFFQQKEPIEIFKDVEFSGRAEFSGKYWSHRATKEQKIILSKAYLSYIKNHGR